MAPFLFGERAGVHIIDLEQALGYLHEAQAAARDVAARGDKILFVGTKRQGKESIKAAATRCGMPYVTERWLGGLLTNWQTISERLKILARLSEEKAAGAWDRLPKKEVARKNDLLGRLEMLLGGIRDLEQPPAALYVADVVREDLAMAEARKLGLMVIGVVDSNANPAVATYPIPGNDDAVRAITIVAEAIAGAVAEGVAQHAAAVPAAPAVPASASPADTATAPNNAAPAAVPPPEAVPAAPAEAS